MRIIHVLSSLQVGGAEWAAIRLAAEQRRLGHDAQVLGLAGGPLLERCREHGVPVHVLNARGILLRLHAFLYFVRKHPDVVNGHNPSAYGLARMCRVAGRPTLVMTIHGAASRSYRRLLAWPQVDMVIAVSAAAHEAFVGMHPGFPSERLIIIENGVPLPDLSSAQQADSTSTHAGPILLSVARLDPIKDFPTLLHAVALIAPAISGLQLLVAGDGPERSRLEQLAAELHLSGTVTFLGFRSDVGRLLADADVFVLSSHSEGMPLSILEAMAAGLPVVASAVGGTPELVLDAITGLLVPSGDPFALATALDRLCRSPALRNKMGQAARARVAEHFSLDRMARRYLESYNSMQARRGFRTGEA